MARRIIICVVVYTKRHSSAGGRSVESIRRDAIPEGSLFISGRSQPSSWVDQIRGHPRGSPGLLRRRRVCIPTFRSSQLGVRHGLGPPGSLIDPPLAGQATSSSAEAGRHWRVGLLARSDRLGHSKPGRPDADPEVRPGRDQGPDLEHPARNRRRASLGPPRLARAEARPPVSRPVRRARYPVCPGGT